MKRLLIVVPIAVAALIALFWSQRRGGPFCVSGFIESHQIRVGSRVGGRVAAVRAAEGQRVAAGEPLLELEPYDLRERLAEAQATLSAQRAQLEKLRAGPRREEIEAARAARDRAQAVLDKLIAGPRPLEISIQQDKVDFAQAEWIKAQKDHDRIKALYAGGQAGREEMDEAERRLAVAQASLAAARDALELLKEGTRTEEIAEAKARLAESQHALALLEAGSRAEDIAQAQALAAAAEAVVAAIERQLAELTVRSPLDGVVEALDLRPGDLIAPNAPVVALTDPSELWVRAYVPENRLGIRLGQEVSVRADSFPHRYFAGRITFISREAEFTPSNIQTPEERSKQVFRIKVVLDEGLDLLRAGMSADVFLEPPK